MATVTFENFFEQGASTFDSSVKELQRAYDEVVWGIESPPSYIEKKDKSVRFDTAKHGRMNTRQQQHYLLHPQPSQNGTMTQGYNLLRTPTIGKKIYQAAPTSNNSIQGTPTTDNDSWGDESTLSESSISESKQPRRSWKYAIAPKSSKSKKNPIKNMLKGTGKKRPRQPSNKIGQKIESNKPQSIDQLFGYNTKQTITVTKNRSDQDVGLDFCVLDIPLSPNMVKKRSLLLVQSIDSRGLFAKTDLGVGDAVLSINGTAFQQERNSRRSARPNLFQARALLNGRGRSVTIEYQKFGETNTSVCSSSDEHQQRALLKDTAFLSHEGSPSKRESSHSRRSSTRVDFLGKLRTTNSPKKGKARTVQNNRLMDRTPSYDDDEEEENLHKESQQVEAPPRISRLTRLKTRTQKLKLSSKNTNTNANKQVEVTKVRYGKENQDINGDREALLPQGTKEPPPESSALPYCSLLNNGPEEKIQQLKERVFSANPVASCTASSPARSEPDRTTPSKMTIASPARSTTFSESKTAAFSPARSTQSARSESYLQDLRKGLSPTANAILEDLSFGIPSYPEASQPPPQRKDSSSSNNSNISKDNSNSSGSNQLPPSNYSPESHSREIIRITKTTFDKLHTRIEGLKKTNLKLSNELSSLKQNRDTGSQRLAQAQKQLEQNEAKEQVYVSQLGLLKSRLEISTIQSDKRHRELLESKEKSIADNDKVIAILTKRIEGMETANQRLLEKLQKVDTKRQEKYNNLQAQFDRLKMKFSAQSTLLDNVMTANENLTSQNEAMESELMDLNAKKNRSKHDGGDPTTTGMIFAEGSEFEPDHMQRDPIILAQAKELSSCKEKNANLEDQVESLHKRIKELTAERNAAASKSLKNKITPSLLDVTLTSSSGDSSIKSGRSSLCQINEDEAEEAPPNSSSDDPNVSVENPSDESGDGDGFLNPMPAASTNFTSSITPATTFQLKYQHEYSNGNANGHGAVNDQQENDESSVETVSTSNHSRHRRPSNMPPAQHADESFESTNSLVLMTRILELETALQDTNLTPEESEKLRKALQERTSTLTARGYEKVGSVDVSDTADMTDMTEASI